MAKNWTLMGTHGIVLFFIASAPDTTMRQMSEALGITERRVGQVVRDLDEAGMLLVTKVGRRNTYTINPDARFRHRTLSHLTLGKFLNVLRCRI